jgi:hypothetical protein
LFDLGGLPERPMGGDCKSPGSAFEGSNPSPATSKSLRDCPDDLRLRDAIVLKNL